MDATSRLRTNAAHAVCVLLCGLACVGCVATKQFTLPGAATHGTPCQIVATWQPDIALSPDPTKNGAPSPGITGRLYLFGPEIKDSLLADGSLVVDLYDETPLATGKPAIQLEQWRLDKDTLKKLQRRDAIGWGYTLFLPWGTYRPDVGQVRLRARFEMANAAPLFSESAPLFLRNRSAMPATTVTQVSTPEGNMVTTQTIKPVGPVLPITPPQTLPQMATAAGFATERR